MAFLTEAAICVGMMATVLDDCGVTVDETLSEVAVTTRGHALWGVLELAMMVMMG